jgi:hypothetical protein
VGSSFPCSPNPHLKECIRATPPHDGCPTSHCMKNKKVEDSLIPFSSLCCISCSRPTPGRAGFSVEGCLFHLWRGPLGALDCIHLSNLETHCGTGRFPLNLYGSLPTASLPFTCAGVFPFAIHKCDHMNTIVLSWLIPCSILVHVPEIGPSILRLF